MVFLKINYAERKLKNENGSMYLLKCKFLLYVVWKCKTAIINNYKYFDQKLIDKNVLKSSI